MTLTPAVRAHIAMFSFSALISTSFTVGAAITDNLDPLALTFVRFGFAGLIFLAIVAATERIRLPGIADCGRYLVLGFFLHLYFILMFEALRWSAPVNLGAVFTLAPPITAVASLVLLSQPISLRLGITLILSAAGAVWVLFGGAWENLRTFTVGWGEFVFLVGAASYAIYSPMVRLLHRGEPLTVMTFWTIIAGMVLLFAWGWRTIIGVDWFAVPTSVYAGIIYLAIATTAITFYLIQYANLRIPSVKVMAYTYLIPVFVLIQQVALGAEWPAPSVMVAIGVITVAMFALQTIRD